MAPTHPWAEDGEPFAYGILLDDSDARVENLTMRGPAEGRGARSSSTVAHRSIEGVDIVLATNRTDEWYYKRSAFRIQGGSTPVIRDSTWDGVHQDQRGGHLSEVRGQHHDGAASSPSAHPVRRR